MLIAVLNAQFHLFQEVINPFTAVIVLENTSQMILVMIDHHVTTEVQDIPETTEAQDIPETTEAHEIPETTIDKIQL